MYFPQRNKNIQYEDLVLFNVEINDTYNAKVLGQTNNYCWDEVCTFPPVSVIGNPGTYTLSLKIKSFGMYPNFLQNSVDITIKILECNESSYVNSVVGNTHLKSCYTPKCEFNCNNRGVCVNNDLCDCGESNFKGRFCEEYTKLEKHPSFDKFYIVIALILIFIIIGLIGMTIYYRKNPIIKGGGIEFLILILIGLIFNAVNIIFLTFEKTTRRCYQTYLFSNTGFSFVFGSIFVKTYRIYIIFSQKNKNLIVILKRSTMFLIIALITLFHWLMVIWWYILKKNVTVENNYTADNREYVKCKYPSSKHVSSLFNFLILIIEFAMSYSIRRVDKKYKESLIIPAYSYISYMLLMYFMENQKEINVVILDYSDIIGTIIITLINIYDLFIIKFIEIFTVKPKEPSQRAITVVVRYKNTNEK